MYFILLPMHTKVSTSFFSCQPLLGCLKNMTSVPLSDEIVYGRPPGPSNIITEDAIEAVRSHGLKFADN